MGVDETFVHGVRYGQHTIWRFGQLVVDENFNDRGKLDGPYVQWRDGHKVMRVKGQYASGKRDGAWDWYDRDNNKEREGTYVDGKKDGAWTEWYENKISFTGTFTRGKPDGTFTYFNREGSELGHFDIKDGTGIDAHVVAESKGREQATRRSGRQRRARISSTRRAASSSSKVTSTPTSARRVERVDGARRDDARGLLPARSARRQGEEVRRRQAVARGDATRTARPKAATPSIATASRR